MTRRAIIKRRFAVVLEDAIEVPVPDDVAVADLTDWATENYDDLLVAAIEAHRDRETGRPVDDDAPGLWWEDEHYADLDWPEDEITAEIVEAP